ncbi:hypothetical protein PSHT_15574 [Puccinia striiformis]|uniref:3-carboxymuconate cyclase n=1 Tax=Puccinia striiformis TaxID=27350 RepID=A0A2S4UEK8_9BASI|nr:hypothetical protein PSHT_15574 [Puccinia striiformis]
MAIRKAFFISTLAWFASQCQISSAAVKLRDTLPASLQLYVAEALDVKLYSFDTVQGTFFMQQTTDALGPNVTWMDLDKTNKFLLSTSVANFDKREKTGAVFSAAIAPNGTLTPVNVVPSPEGPVSLEGSPDGKIVMVASFTGASLTSYKLGADGKLSQPGQNVIFTGSGPVPGRQAAAAAHQVQLDPTGKLLLVPDLGSDRSERSLLKEMEISFYVVCELSNEVIVVELSDIQANTVSFKQVITTLPKGTNATNFFAAEVLITPDGKFLYVTNRQTTPDARVDDNTFAIYARNQTDGTLIPFGFSPTGGRGSQNFAFSPDKAASLVVTNKDSNLVTIHKRDPGSGALNQIASVPCLAPSVALFRG